MSDETSLYASITKDQLISMIHFLEKRGEESKKESDDLKALLKSLREEYRTDTELNQRLLKTIEMLTQQVSDITAENKKLRQQIDKLLKQISASGKGRF
jgi:uncharacterized protein (UPF0335 family)